MKVRSRAERDGFLFCQAIVPVEAVQALRRVVLQAAEEAGWLDAATPTEFARVSAGQRVGDGEGADWVELQAKVQSQSAFWELAKSPGIRRILRALVDSDDDILLTTANCIRLVSPHPELATRPHQDANYLQSLERFWTVWIPLGDCLLSLGPLAVCAGSHRSGMLPHAHDDARKGAEVPAEAVWQSTSFACGDALFFSNLTLHRALPNRSRTTLRISADFRFDLTSKIEGAPFQEPAPD